MLNAAVWLGATLFFTISVAPALSSSAAQQVLGARYFDYLSGALWQVALARMFYWHIVCSIVALLHLVAEWLYLGRTAKNLWRIMLYCLFILSLAGGIWLAPKLRELNRTQYAPTVKLEERQAAAKGFRFWRGAFDAVNVLMIAGIAAYFWRAANPPDELRFVGSTKFRG